MTHAGHNPRQDYANGHQGGPIVKRPHVPKESPFPELKPSGLALIRFWGAMDDLAAAEGAIRPTKELDARRMHAQDCWKEWQKYIPNPSH